MTNEELNEAIRYLEEERLTVEAILYGENQDKFDSTIMLINDAKFRESRKPLTIYDMAIKALEQQPCEDCISREAAIGIVAHIKEMHINDREQYQINYGTICDIDLAIQQLSSVTPQPKAGHWEWIQYDSNPNIGNWHCSECRNIVIECANKNEKGDIPKYNFCPNCGADMRESEDEE